MGTEADEEGAAVLGSDGYVLDACHLQAGCRPCRPGRHPACEPRRIPSHDRPAAHGRHLLQNLSVARSSATAFDSLGVWDWHRGGVRSAVLVSMVTAMTCATRHVALCVNMWRKLDVYRSVARWDVRAPPGVSGQPEPVTLPPGDLLGWTGGRLRLVVEGSAGPSRLRRSSFERRDGVKSPHRATQGARPAATGQSGRARDGDPTAVPLRCGARSAGARRCWASPAARRGPRLGARSWRGR